MRNPSCRLLTASAMLAITVGITLEPAPAKACFDVYLIQLGNPIVYNNQELSLKLAGEYAFANGNQPEGDALTLEPGAYYGITDDLTAAVQSSFGVNRLSGVADEFQSVGAGLFFAALREPLGITPAIEGAYSLVEKGAFDLTASMILTKGYDSWFVVLHPKVELARASGASEWNGGYHAGLFYRFGANSTVGWGHEYFARDNELVTSLFVGALITESVYMHWELIKGISESAADWGSAVNLKYVLPL